MSTSPSYQPAGYHSVTPYLVIDGAEQAIQFYQTAFGATLILRLDLPNGKVAHAEIQIGDSRIMLSDENPAWNNKGPKSLGGTATSLMIYVPDCDAIYARAIATGAKALMPVADQFYGDRSGTVEDPFGHKWHISTCQEIVSPEEMQRRAQALFAQT